jgi:hypothetical protein
MGLSTVTLSTHQLRIFFRMVSKIGHENRDENGDLTDLTNTNCDLKKKSWELMGVNQQTL